LGNVTLALDEDTEKALRRIAKERFHGGKGSMAKVVRLGVEKMKDENSRERAVKRLKEQMDRGFDGGKILYKHRSELYERD